MTQRYHPDVRVKIEDGTVVVERLSERKFHHALHGLTRSLIANAITGVTEGYSKTLELMGVGYRVQQAGNGIILTVGYSHPVEIHPLEGVTLEVEGNNRIHIRGIDKQKVGSLAAQVRKMRPPNPTKKRASDTRVKCCTLNPGRPPPTKLNVLVSSRPGAGAGDEPPDRLESGTWGCAPEHRYWRI